MIGMILWGCICWRYDGFSFGPGRLVSTNSNILNGKFYPEKFGFYHKDLASSGIKYGIISQISKMKKCVEIFGKMECESPKHHVNQRVVSLQSPLENKALLRIMVVHNLLNQTSFPWGGWHWGGMPSNAGPQKFLKLRLVWGPRQEDHNQGNTCQNSKVLAQKHQELWNFVMMLLSWQGCLCWVELLFQCNQGGGFVMNKSRDSLGFVHSGVISSVPKTSRLLWYKRSLKIPPISGELNNISFWPSGSFQQTHLENPANKLLARCEFSMETRDNPPIKRKLHIVSMIFLLLEDVDVSFSHVPSQRKVA